MQKIRIDFDNPGLPQHISAVENDSQSRFFQATLYENGKAYTAPAGASYSIMYRGFGPQNQGWYDTINDGAGKRAACTASGNVVTCEIARQALQVPGHVSVVLCVTTGKGYMLKSWPIECDCKNDRYDSTAEIQSFFYITQVSNESWTQAIQAVEELKNTIDPTLSLSGKAADAAKVGEAVNAEATRAKAAEEENANGVSQLNEDFNEYINYDENDIISFDDTNGNNKGSIPSRQMYIVNKAFGKVFLKNITFNPGIVSVTHIYLFEKIDNTLKLVKDILWNSTVLGTASRYTMPINQSFKNLMIGMRKDESSVDAPKYNTGKLTYGFLIYNNFSEDSEFDISNVTVFEQGSLQIGLEYITKHIPDNNYDNYIIVSKNGDGDYMTVADAINNANGKPIYIKNGVYDEEIKCDDKEITLLGQDKYRTIIRAKNGLYGHDPIYLSRGYIENITFYAQYVSGESTEIGSQSGAYAVHLDSSYEYNGGSVLFNNCRLISDFAPALGSGLRGNFTAEFLDCDFISNQNGIGYKHETGGVGAVYVHNDHTGKLIQANQKIALRNCICKAHMTNVLYLLTVKNNITPDAYAEFESINTVYYSETNGTKNIVVNAGSGVWHYSNLNHGNNVTLS